MSRISICLIVCAFLNVSLEAELEVSCVYPLLDDGYLLHADDIFTENQGTVHVGSLLTPVCKGREPGEAFVLVGSGSLTCNPDGNWAPSPFPECYRATAGCELESFENGIVTLGSSDAQFISFKCYPGFRLVGPETLTCGVAGDARGPDSVHQWTERAPYCLEIPTTTTQEPVTTPEPTTTTPKPTTPLPLVVAYTSREDSEGYCQGASKYWTVWHICDCNLTCTYVAYAVVILCVPLIVIAAVAVLLHRYSKPSNTVSIRPNASKFVKPVKMTTLNSSVDALPEDYLVPVPSGNEPRYNQPPAEGSTVRLVKDRHDYEDCV